MGTWALPQTKKQAEDLKQLIKEPLKANEACKKLYDLLGADDLFDEIEQYSREEGKDYDISPLVKIYINKILNEYKQTPENFSKPFESDAIKILKTI
jgi:hypothetical protein